MTHNNELLLWYHGKISRDIATQKLSTSSSGRDGFFLIRDCSSAPGDYVLSLLKNRQVMHFQVHCLGDNKFSIDDGPVFNGLDLLTAHYRTNPDGLPCRLTNFCRGNFPPLFTLKYGEDTKLHKLCSQKDVSGVKQLLHQADFNKKDLNARNKQGNALLHIACMGRDDKMVSMLCHEQADTSVTESTGKTAMQLVCAAGNASILRILISQGHADFHERSPMSGWVPLHEVAARNFLECVKVLLSFNASIHPRTSEGDTPKDLALRNNNHEIVEFFETYPLPSPKTSIHQWLHEGLDRNAAVNQLDSAGLQDGLFLIRSSTKCHGYHVLSLVYDMKVFHFKINSRADCSFYIDDGPLFETLSHLVDHYMQYADGLPAILKKPVSSARQSGSKRSPALQPSRASPDPLKLPPRPSQRVKDLPNIPRTTNSDDELDNFNNMSQFSPKPIIPRPSVRPPVPITRTGHSVKGTPLPDPRTVHSKSQPVKTQGVIGQQTVIQRDSLEMGQELGVGEFGSVLKGTWINSEGNKIPVALKTLHQDKLQQGEKEFLREARVMSQLNHPCIVRLLGVCLGPPMILVQELVTMGALLDHLIDHQPEIQDIDLKLWAAQIAWGMMYLEQRRFVHRDLATRNILLANKNQAKISDFGLSRAVGAGSDYYQAQQGGRWPVKWYSPESINYGTFSQKSDVWSYGVTLWEMFTYGELPYGEMSGAEVISLLERGQRLDQPEKCPDHTYQIMLRCWHIDPAHRPTFKELHTIFSTDPEYEDARKYRERLKK